MESDASWDAENRRAFEEIRRALYGVLARGVATEDSPPSPRGRTVDAVARKGFYVARLAELARIEARIDALKARLSLENPGTAPAPAAPIHSTLGREG